MNEFGREEDTLVVGESGSSGKLGKIRCSVFAAVIGLLFVVF